MNRFILSFGLAFGLWGCETIPFQPPNPEITRQIVQACVMDGVFKNFGGRLVLNMIPVPGVATADQIIAIGVDKVCENPERFSGDVSTVAWVIKNLRK